MHVYISYDSLTNQFQYEVGLELDASICEMAALRAETITVHVVDELQEKDRAVFQENKTQCYIGTPIYIGTEPFGTLCFTSSQRRADEFSPADRDIVHLLAQWIGNEMYRMQTEAQSIKHKNELEHAVRVGTLGEMASGLAHEINQPLTAISNYLKGYLRRYTDEGRQTEQQAIKKAINEAERAAMIVKQMREFVQKRAQDKRLIQLNECIIYAVDMMKHAFSDHNISHKLQLDEQLIETYADRIQIEQVMINLLINSHDALRSKEPSGCVVVSSKMLDKGMIGITVSDNGVGVESEKLEDIFHPFSTDKSSGMGLGLSISRSIIEFHQGTMLAFINKKNGLTIDIRIPVERYLDV